MKVKKSAPAAYRVNYHIVWSTRFKKKILKKGVRKYLRLKMLEVKKYYPDWHFETIGFGDDHIYLQIEFPPKYSGSYVVEIIKKNTSRALKEKFEFLKEVYWDDGGIWSVGYFFSTLGINDEIIKKYIERQWREDSGQAKLEF